MSIRIISYRRLRQLEAAERMNSAHYVRDTLQRALDEIEQLIKDFRMSCGTAASNFQVIPDMADREELARLQRLRLDLKMSIRAMNGDVGDCRGAA